MLTLKKEGHLTYIAGFYILKRFTLSLHLMFNFLVKYRNKILIGQQYAEASNSGIPRIQRLSLVVASNKHLILVIHEPCLPHYVAYEQSNCNALGGQHSSLITPLIQFVNQISLRHFHFIINYGDSHCSHWLLNQS